jgi:hypothetical protein
MGSPVDTGAMKEAATNTHERGMGSPRSAGLNSHVTQKRGLGSPGVSASKNEGAANTRERGMGSPSNAGLSSHATSSAGPSSHATQVWGMGSPGAPVNKTSMAARNKVAKKWDRKLRNRTQKKNERGQQAETLKECLEAPRLSSGEVVTGLNKVKHRVENKRKRIERQESQQTTSYWTEHRGQFTVATPKTARPAHRGSMCPGGLATLHPAAPLLLEYAMNGCPAKTGKPWTREEMEAAIKKGPHVSALEPAARSQLQKEVMEKEAKGAVKVVLWEDIKDNPPAELKVSPIAMIPHKSRLYRAILDLSFKLRLSPDELMRSVNESTEKNSTKGGNRPAWTFAVKNYSCVCRGRRRCEGVHGEVGHQGWLLATGL